MSMTDEQNALVPVDERVVDFYGDELTAVLVREAGREEIYVPVRPIADYLGLTWSSQYMRLQRDRILGEAIRGVLVTRTPGRGGGRQEMVALPLKFIPGWLFGISVNRVREELRDRILRYQRECYDALWEAFQEGRLTADEDFETLLARADPDVVQAYQIARAVVRLARNQVLMEARLTGRLDDQQRQVSDHEVRLEELEMTLGDPGRVITPAQATRISQAVKAIALDLGKKTGRNEFGGVYGEFYRRFEIPGYRELSARRFEEAMEFLAEWWRELTGSDQVPF
jgi:hypothetical protein